MVPSYGGLRPLSEEEQEDLRTSRSRRRRGQYRRRERLRVTLHRLRDGFEAGSGWCHLLRVLGQSDCEVVYGAGTTHLTQTLQQYLPVDLVTHVLLDYFAVPAVDFAQRTVTVVTGYDVQHRLRTEGLVVTSGYRQQDYQVAPGRFRLRYSYCPGTDQGESDSCDLAVQGHVLRGRYRHHSSDYLFNSHDSEHETPDFQVDLAEFAEAVVGDPDECQYVLPGQLKTYLQPVFDSLFQVRHPYEFYCPYSGYFGLREPDGVANLQPSLHSVTLEEDGVGSLRRLVPLAEDFDYFESD